MIQYHIAVMCVKNCLKSPLLPIVRNIQGPAVPPISGAVPGSRRPCSPTYVAVKSKTQSIYTKALQIFISFDHNFLFRGQFCILFTFYFTVKRRIFSVTYFSTSQIWFTLTSAKKKREKQQEQSNKIIKLHRKISSWLPTPNQQTIELLFR